MIDSCGTVHCLIFPLESFPYVQLHICLIKCSNHINNNNNNNYIWQLHKLLHTTCRTCYLLVCYLVARDVGSMCQMRTPDWHATASTDAELGLYENAQHNIVNVLWLKKLSAVIENFYQADSCFNHNSIFFRRNLTKFSITCARHFYKILCFLYRTWFKFLLVLILYQFKVDFIFVNCLTMRVKFFRLDFL